MAKEKIKNGVIYSVFCRVGTQKGYVGQHCTENPAGRWRRHLAEALAGSKHPFHRAIVKYGWENFEKKIVRTIPCGLLNEKETFYIDKLGTFIDDPRGGGYNLTRGGGVGAWSKRSRKKLSNSLKGKPKSESHRASMRAAQSGRVMSDAACASISAGVRSSYADPVIGAVRRAKIGKVTSDFWKSLPKEEKERRKAFRLERSNSPSARSKRETTFAANPDLRKGTPEKAAKCSAASLLRWSGKTKEERSTEVRKYHWGIHSTPEYKRAVALQAQQTRRVNGTTGKQIGDKISHTWNLKTPKEIAVIVAKRKASRAANKKAAAYA